MGITGEHNCFLIWNYFLWLRRLEVETGQRLHTFFRVLLRQNNCFCKDVARWFSPGGRRGVPSAPRPGQLGPAHLGVERRPTLSPRLGPPGVLSGLW